MRPFPTALALGLSLMGLALGGDAAAAEKKDVIVVIWDATRPDHLTPYGYERDTTPNLKALAAGATRFDDARSSGSRTMPGVASLFTGLFPHNHLIDFDPRRSLSELPADAVTLAEAFDQQGYYTALFTEQALYNTDAYMQGFDRHERTGSGAFKDKVVEVMEAAGDQPVFLVLHWLNPDLPYAPPKLHDLYGDPEKAPPTVVASASDKKGAGDLTPLEINGRADPLDAGQWAELVDAYDGELHSNDQRTQNCFERYARFRELDDAVVVFTADHGTMFNERPEQRIWYGWPTHESLRVPLVIKAPGQTAGAVVDGPVRSIDVYPTVLELAGLQAPAAINGQSLAPLMKGGTASGRPNIGATLLWDGLGFYQDDDYSIIVPRKDGAPGYLYDLRADPGETKNLAESQPETYDQVKERMRAFLLESRVSLGE